MSDLKNIPPFPQGEPAFVPLLREHVPFVPHWEENRSAGEDELDLTRGAVLQPDFPDPEKLLDTAYFDFKRFLSESGLTGEIPVTVRYVDGMDYESFRLAVETQGITLESSDTEGIRRGLYHLRDRIAGSPYLKLGDFLRKPWLKNRISRCFFGPIKRPPFNIDELMNDIDYYPDEYLSRLAHEGVNGLWLTVTFREICDTGIRKAPPEAARRLAKLRTTVERCRRYGIKIWTFCIEPIYWSLGNDNPVPPGCEELLGPGLSREEAGVEMNSFCVNSDMAKQYLYEATYSLFSNVPHLGGMLTISHGERITSCLSCIKPQSDGSIPCKKRCNLSIGEILASVLGSMKQGMHDANPDAELISWLYVPYVNQVSDWMTRMPSELKNNVALAFNFESGVSKYQLGSVRVGGDYWLSESGPSERFVMMREAARGKCEFAAKIQAACSHECATVPYIPAPGLLYRKYRSMKEMGISHVIQCWYFGNYPGLMNEAAGKLAYEDFSGTEDDFLEELARPEWGRDWQYAVQAWKHFADGYSNYPLDIQFQYYGPMHDGPVWPLHLKLAMKPLTRSWKPETFPSGDALGECMKHFSLYELAELGQRMSAEWHKGLEVLKQADRRDHELEFTLAEALNIQFRSGRNILKFYTMRNALLDSPSDSGILLEGMKAIVREEITNSLRLAELCRQDARLGYHSEAEVYKYFPKKLRWRAGLLEELLKTDFAEAEKILQSGGSITGYLDGREPAVSGAEYGSETIRWKFEYDSENVTFFLQFKGDNSNPEVVYLFLMDSKGARMPLIPAAINSRDGVKDADGWHTEVKISRNELGFASDFFFGIERVEFLPAGQKRHTNDNAGEFIHDPRLYLGFFGADKLRKVSLKSKS